MSKFMKPAIATGVVAISLGLVACQPTPAPEPVEDPQVVIQEGLASLMEVTSSSYNVVLNGDLKLPEGDDSSNISFNLTASGSADAKDVQDPKFNLSLKGDMAVGPDGGDFEAAFRMNKEAVYLSLMSLNGRGELADVFLDEIRSEIVGKWWTMAIPPEVMSELAQSMPSAGADNMTEEQKAMQNLVAQTKFFKDVEYKGSENVGGESSHHYTVVLDNDALVDFVVQAARLQGETLSQSDINDMKDGLKILSFAGDIYVGSNSGILNKAKGILTIAAADAYSPSGTVTLEISGSDFNKPVTVQVPSGAEEIPLDAIAELLMMM